MRAPLLICCSAVFATVSCDRALPLIDRDAGLFDLAATSDQSVVDPLDPAQKDAIEACVIAASCGAFPVNWCLDRLNQLQTPPPSSHDDQLLGQNFLVGIPGSWVRLGRDCDQLKRSLQQPTLALASCESDAICDGTSIAWTAGAPVVDCTKLGEACAETTDRPGACCGRACGANLNTACNGDLALSCQSGVQTTFDCHRYQLKCAAGLSAPCDGDGGSCGPGDPVQCSGARATYCPASHSATFDCSSTLFPSQCNAGARYLPCRPVEGDCKGSDWATCDGSSMVVCAGGWRHKIDCRSLGFGDCATPNGGPAVCVK